MYTLARTQKIYGSFQSSFSNIAAQLGRVPLEILKLQAPHFSICFNSFFPPPFIYRQNALPVGVPVMKEHPVIVLSSSFSAKSIMLHFYTQQKYKNEKRPTRQNRGDAYVRYLYLTRCLVCKNLGIFIEDYVVICRIHASNVLFMPVNNLFQGGKLFVSYA